MNINIISYLFSKYGVWTITFLKPFTFDIPFLIHFQNNQMGQNSIKNLYKISHIFQCVFTIIQMTGQQQTAVSHERQARNEHLSTTILTPSLPLFSLTFDNNR